MVFTLGSQNTARPNSPAVYVALSVTKPVLFPRKRNLPAVDCEKPNVFCAQGCVIYEDLLMALMEWYGNDE